MMPAVRAHDLRNHPLRPLYQLYQDLSTRFVRTPWWIFSNISPCLRPRLSWTLHKAFMVRVLAHQQSVIERIGELPFVGDYINPSVGPGHKQIWIQPAPDRIFNDELQEWISVAQVEPARIPGYWIDKRGLESTPAGAAPAPGEKIALYLHGGAYIMYSGSPKDALGSIVRGILKHTSSITRVFSVEYRLSKAAPSEPAHPFPAALLDALAAYLYLVNVVGTSPENILVLGDSAGANLAHALTRYLVENEGKISGLPPPPSNLLLLSPWMDMGASLAASSAGENADYMGTYDSPLNRYARTAFLGPHGQQLALSRYVSPASSDPRAEPASFVGFPRTMIVGGGAEVLIRSIRTLEERMRRDLGDALTYHEGKDAIHDYLVFPFWEPERTETLQAIATWMEKRPAYSAKL